MPNYELSLVTRTFFYELTIPLRATESSCCGAFEQKKPPKGWKHGNISNNHQCNRQRMKQPRLGARSNGTDEDPRGQEKQGLYGAVVKRCIELLPRLKISMKKYLQRIVLRIFLTFQMRPRISIRDSVRPSVRRSVTPPLRRQRGASYLEYSALFSS